MLKARMGQNAEVAPDFPMYIKQVEYPQYAAGRVTVHGV